MKSFFQQNALLLSLTIGSLSWAEVPTPAACSEQITIQANGLVCDFCARALEKVFGKRKDVQGIDVNLSKKQITLQMNPNASIDNQTVTQLVTQSGYSVVNIQRGCAS